MSGVSETDGKNGFFLQFCAGVEQPYRETSVIEEAVIHVFTRDSLCIWNMSLLWCRLMQNLSSSYNTTCSLSNLHFYWLCIYYLLTLYFNVHSFYTKQTGGVGAPCPQNHTTHITNWYLRVSEGWFFLLRRKRHWELIKGGENNTSRGSGVLSPRGGSGSELPPFFAY